jgi:hypothetical protein
MLSAYVVWREQCAGVADSYRQWCEAPKGGERQWKFAVHLAALDVEEASAGSFALAVAGVEHSLRLDRAA